MSGENNWVLANCIQPNGPGIEGLADTYPWKHFLSDVNTTLLYRALLPEIRGAIFTGPAGNGRHTQAEAFAYSLIAQKLIAPDNFSNTYMILIEPLSLSPKLEEQELKKKVNEVFDSLENLVQNKNHTIAVIFDQIDLYPRRIMDQIAECVSFLEDQNLFTICIGEDETKISRNLLRELIHCRCPNPTAEQRRMYLQQLEKVLVKDTWTKATDPKEKYINIILDEITWEEVADKTEGCSYADLNDLIWMIKLVISKYDVEQFGNNDHIVVRVSRENVLEAIRLCRAVSTEENPMRVFAVPQQSNWSAATNQDENSNIDDDLDFINSVL